jgi:hypothetical protein
MRVVRTKSPWVFEVEDHVTTKVYKAHVSRLRFYADKMINVTEDLFSQVAHSQEGHEVENFEDVRHNKTTARFEVRIKWHSLEVSESSWEPADHVAKDVSGPLKKFLKLRSSDVAAKALLSYLGWKYICPRTKTSLEEGSVAFNAYMHVCHFRFRRNFHIIRKDL